MSKFWLVALVSVLTLGMSGSALALGEGDAHDNDAPGHLSHGNGNGYGHHDDDDDDDHSNYECGPKCKESTQIVLKGRIPCICDITLPTATEVRLFRSRDLARGGSIGAKDIGTFSAECNTGSVYLKIASKNGGLKNLDVDNTYIAYQLDVGGLENFDVNNFGSETSKVWSFMDDQAGALSGSKMLKVNSLGAVDGKIAGRYRDRLTITVSGMPLSE